MSNYPPRNIVAEISGFYPMFEAVLSDTKDPLTTAVHGVMWRFCQLDDGVCKAALETIADILGMSRATVMRRQQALITLGYFKDLTPDLKNKPHVFVDTGKVVMRSQFSAVSRFTQKRHVAVSHLNKEGGGNVFEVFEQNISPLTRMIAEELGDLIDEHSPTWVIAAIREAALNGKRNTKYIGAILKRWKVDGYGTAHPKANGNGHKEQAPDLYPTL